MLSTVVTSKGQATIPKRIRDLLGLRPSDRVIFKVEGGRVFLEAALNSVDDLFGMYSHKARRRAVSVRSMKEALKKKARQRW